MSNQPLNLTESVYRVSQYLLANSLGEHPAQGGGLARGHARSRPSGWPQPLTMGCASIHRLTMV